MRINQLCRANKIAFFSADTFGHSGGFFVDLGAEFSFQREMGTGENQQLSAPQTMRFCSLDAALATRWSELTNRFGLVSPVYVCGQRASRERASSPGAAHTPSSADAQHPHTHDGTRLAIATHSRTAPARPPPPAPLSLRPRYPRARARARARVVRRHHRRGGRRTPSPPMIAERVLAEYQKRFGSRPNPASEEDAAALATLCCDELARNGMPADYLAPSDLRCAEGGRRGGEERHTRRSGRGGRGAFDARVSCG